MFIFVIFDNFYIIMIVFFLWLKLIKLGMWFMVVIVSIKEVEVWGLSNV